MTTTNDDVIVALKAETYLKVLFFNKIEDRGKKMFASFILPFHCLRVCNVMFLVTLSVLVLLFVPSTSIQDKFPIFSVKRVLA